MPTLSELLGVNKANVHPNSRIAQALARQGVSKSPEFNRVFNLPRRKFDPSAYPDASIVYAKGLNGCKGCKYCAKGPPALRSIQNAMLIEAAQNSGLFAQVGVGQGKTLPSLLMHDALGARRTVLLVPPSLRTKTLKIDAPELARHFTLPTIYSEDQARAFGKGKLPDGVYVVAYSELSATNASDLLDYINPDLVVADEAHCLAHKESARTRRFLRFMRTHACKFVPMSGTMEKKSITDFAHLIELALGAGSPVPHDYPSLMAWADAIDNEGEAGHTGIGALALFCEDGESARDGFRRRLRDTPGVISTITTSCEASINIKISRPTPPLQVLQALDLLTSKWTWDGEEYDKAIDIARIERTLTQGFFYRLIWPNGKDTEWLEARNAWSRTIRARLSHQNREGQDSPALLEAMAERGEWICQEWINWQAIRDRVNPDREPVEVSRWLVDIAEKWIAKNSAGLIWVDSPIVGQWLAEAGIPYYGEGTDEELEVYAASVEAGQKAIALSIGSHATGKNLQAWNKNLVLYSPANGGTWEQMIGRTHREGQNADTISFDVILSTDGSNRAFATARTDAERTESTMGQPQKLNIANIIELDFLSEVL